MNLYRFKPVIRADPARSGGIHLCRCDKKIQVLPIPTRCDMLVLLSYPVRQRRGGEIMQEVLISILAAVVGGVICHYIIKWLDSGSNNDN